MGKAVGRSTPSPRRLDRAIRAYELHIERGLRWDQVCAELRISRSTLTRDLQHARSLRLAATVDEYTADALARCARRRRVLEAALDTIPDQARVLEDPETGDRVVVLPDVTAVARLSDSLDRIETQEAKLRGAYPATRHEVTVKQADAWDELNALLAQNDPKKDAAP